MHASCSGNQGFCTGYGTLLWYVTVKKTKSIQESMLYSLRTRPRPAGHCCQDRSGPHYLRYVSYRTVFRNGRTSGRRLHPLHGRPVLAQVRQDARCLIAFPRDAELNVLGNFSRFIPSFLRALIRPRFVQKLLLRLEKKLVKKRERACVRWFDTSLLINRDEAELLRKETGFSSIQTIKPLLANTARSNRPGLRWQPGVRLSRGLEPPAQPVFYRSFHRKPDGTDTKRDPGLQAAGDRQRRRRRFAAPRRTVQRLSYHRRLCRRSGRSLRRLLRHDNTAVVRQRGQDQNTGSVVPGVSRYCPPATVSKGYR